MGVIFVAGVAVSCSSSTPDSIAFADDPLTIEQPESDTFDSDELRLIEFHAEWLCELQRRTFDTLDDAGAVLGDALIDAGIEQDEYDTFLIETLPRQEARDAVLYFHQQNCRAK